MRIVCIVLLLLPLGSRAALIWEPAVSTQAFFSSRPAVLRQDIRNDGDQPTEERFHLRLQQLSSSLAAPVANWEVGKDIVIPAGQTVRVSVQITLPDVVAPTRFRVTWNNGAGKVLGSTEVVGCPPDLFQPLRHITAGSAIGLLGNTTALRAFFRAQDCMVKELSEADDLKAFGGHIVFVVTGGEHSETDKEFGRTAVRHAKEWGGRIVWLIERDNLPLSPEPVVCVWSHGQGTVLVSTGIKLAELDQSPLEQLRLLWLTELALASEENRLLLLGRLMNL